MIDVVRAHRLISTNGDRAVAYSHGTRNFFLRETSTRDRLAAHRPSPAFLRKPVRMESIDDIYAHPSACSCSARILDSMGEM